MNYSDPRHMLQTALVHLQNGRFAEAEQLLQRVQAQRSDDAAVFHAMGLLRAQTGRLAEGIELLRKAIAKSPSNASFYCNLGSMLTKAGMLEEAVAACRQALRLDSRLAEAHHNLGMAMAKQSKFEDAAAAYQQAIRLRPNFAEAYDNLGTALTHLGKLDEAIKLYFQAVAIIPENAALHYKLGQTLMVADRVEESLLGFRNAIQRNPRHFESYASMAISLSILNRFDEAKQFQRHAAAIAPEAACTHQAMGEILLHMHDGAGAIECFLRAVQAAPREPWAWGRLADAYEAQGKFDDAARCHRQLLEIDPFYSAGYKGLAGPDGTPSSHAKVQQLTTTLNNPNLSKNARIQSLFALGRALDDLNCYDEAFARFAEANTLTKELRRQAGERYDSEAMKRRIDNLIRVYTPEFFHQRTNWGVESEAPVFVVGMPRSGTTLAQQIAASHPQVHGAGELGEISGIAKSLGDTPCAVAWTREAIAMVAQRHLKYLRQLNATADRIIDKMPGNVLELGLIAVMYPRARVVICRRDPRDNCLSCYFQMFHTGNSFSYELADCGSYQVETDRLIEHWKRVLPLKMFEFQYESVVEDLEGQSRRLIDFLGLPWNPKCLEFHKTANTVLTASVWQVRQPIFKTSVGRWRHYERHLGPMTEVLNSAGK